MRQDLLYHISGIVLVTRSRAQSGCVGKAAILFAFPVFLFFVFFVFFFVTDVTNHLVLTGRDGRVDIHLRLIVANC